MTKIQLMEDFKKYEKYVYTLLTSDRRLKVYNACNSSYDMEDLVQEGRLAIVEALKNYETKGDPTKSNQSTFVYGHLRKRLINLSKTCSRKKRMREEIQFEEAIREGKIK